MTEPEAMERALALALRGWGRVAPNPLVGCVLLKHGQMVGEGFHAEFGGPHAEVAALRSCADPRGATCVVNLEPCAHAGKTPPCADALIEAGVHRVVYANADPDPKAQGGAARLRAGGLEVEPGVGGKAGAALNAPFLWAHARPERPFVAVKLATSLDGFLADATSASRWISGAEAREYVHWLRAGFDALAVGRRTAEVDDPALTVRGPVAPRVPPVRVIWTASGAIRAGLKVFTTLDAAPTWVVTTPSRTQDVGRRLGLEPDAVLGADGVVAGLQALRGRGVGALLVEGGGALAGALWAADVVDRLYWIQAPLWLGSGVSAFGGHRPSPLGEARAWVVTERRPLGVDTLLVVDRTLCLPES